MWSRESAHYNRRQREQLREVLRQAMIRCWDMRICSRDIKKSEKVSKEPFLCIWISSNFLMLHGEVGRTLSKTTPRKWNVG